MLYSPVFAPLPHGAAGILDELLLFGAPLLAVIIIVVIASRRARKKAPKERTRSPSQSVQPPDDSTDTLP